MSQAVEMALIAFKRLSKENREMKINGYIIEENADLNGANLSGADLRGANLRGANLSWANLYDSDLRDSDLRDSDLRGANLSWANLRDSDLRDSDLNGASLRGANLHGANLRDSDLRDSDLDYSCIPLWCGGQSAKIDSKLAKQFLLHALSFECEDEEYRQIREVAREYLKNSHIAKHIEWIKNE